MKIGRVLPAAWLPIFLMGVSLWFLIFGVLVLDFAIQAVHVTNQALIFKALVAVYMVFYSAAGALASAWSH